MHSHTHTHTHMHTHTHTAMHTHTPTHTHTHSLAYLFMMTTSCIQMLTHAFAQGFVAAAAVQTAQPAPKDSPSASSLDAAPAPGAASTQYADSGNPSAAFEALLRSPVHQCALSNCSRCYSTICLTGNLSVAFEALLRSPLNQCALLVPHDCAVDLRC